MSANVSKAQPSIATRLLAGVSVPDTPLISRAIDFARDLGERFVPGYKPASTVDYLLNSPFKE